MLAKFVDDDGDLDLPRRCTVCCAGGEEEEAGSAAATPGAPTERDDLVLSEVHLSRKAGTNQTVFTLSDGSELLRVQHAHATPLSAVGLQVWRGALVLADYLLATQASAAYTAGVALELGTGPGVAGLVLARLGCPCVYLTDAPVHDVLGNCQANVEANADALPGTVKVRALDWLRPPPWVVEDSVPHPAASPEAFAWQPSDVGSLSQLSCILAADCCYEDHLTDSLMQIAALLMRRAKRSTGRSPVLLVAMERRINFTMRDLDICSPAYDHWRSLFVSLDEVEQGDSSTRGEVELSKAAAAGKDVRCATLGLVGRRIDVMSMPQLVQGYERSDYLELWELLLAPQG